MKLSPNEIAVMFLSLGVLLFTAKLFGEIAKKYGQPAVLGEILAGVILGPTVLGTILPGLEHFLFPAEGLRKVVMESIATISVVLFLLVAGLEADIATIRRQGRTVFNISISGIIVPFSLGFLIAYFYPNIMGMHEGIDKTIFSLFIATALSITALPVITKTLMDLNYYKSEMGMTIVASAIFDDIIGWMLFAVILSLAGNSVAPMPLYMTIILTLGFTFFMVTVMRKIIHKTLPWVQAHFSWPDGVLASALALTMVGAAVTEFIGIHAIFGAFLVGLALGDTHHFREKTRTVIEQFVAAFFAPLFFASIGLKVNFIANFDLVITLAFLVIGTIGKVLGCGLAAKISGRGMRESLAIGFAMNARGTMEIILGLIALNFGLIDEKVFVALVILAIVTSMLSGPAMKSLLRLKKNISFRDFLDPKAFVFMDTPVKKSDFLDKLIQSAVTSTGLDFDMVRNGIYDREAIMPTGLKNGIAIPHTRIRGLKKPIIATGITTGGADFGSSDGSLTYCAFLILSPTDDNITQLEILADIARTFKAQGFDGKAEKPENFTEFLSFLKSVS